MAFFSFMVVCMKQRVCSGQLDKTEGSRDNFRHCAPTPFYFCSSSVLAFENIALYTLEPEEQKKILGYFSLPSKDHGCPEALVELCIIMSVPAYLLLALMPKKTKIYVVKLLFSDVWLNLVLDG